MLIFEKSMGNSYKFKVAGHVFEAVLPDGLTAEAVLRPYLPFTYEGPEENLFSIRLEYTDDLASLYSGWKYESMNTEAPYFWILEKDGKHRYGFSYSSSHPDFVMMTADDFSDAVVYVPSSKHKSLTEFSLSNAMMLMYTFRSSPYETLMTHASVIRYEDGGYMFLGRSGTGKSTHSRMWLENISGASLLNDDNPIVRVVDGKAYIYGSPWSGKTPCYKNEVVPLKGVVRIVRAPHNRAVRLNPLQAYASLKPSCSCMKWDRDSNDNLHSTVEKVISMVPCWNMECLPDPDAARVCRDAVTSSHNFKR